MVEYANADNVNDLLASNVKVPGQLDFENIKQYSVKDRYNLVTLENMTRPGEDPGARMGCP